MQVNGNNRKAWQSYDPETISNERGGVSHSASIVRNLRAMGEDTLHVIPDRAVEYAVRGMHSGIFAVITTPVLFVWGLIVDVAEAIAYPLMIVKNFFDILAHAFMLLINAFKGETDGAAGSVDPYEWKAKSSVFPQFQGKNMRNVSMNGDAVPATTAAAMAPPRRSISG